MKKKSKKVIIKKKSNSTSNVGCFYCGKKFGYSLPFKCRHCEHLFCGDHRLPENHKCQNFERGVWVFQKNPKEHIKKPHTTCSENTEFPDVRLPRKVRLPKVTKKVVVALSIVLLLAFEFLLDQYLILTIDVLITIGTIYLIYKLFLRASRIDISSDLRLFGLRILSVIIVIIGFIMLYLALMSSIFTINDDTVFFYSPFSVFYVFLGIIGNPEFFYSPFSVFFVFLGILGLGLILLGIYLIFRFMLHSGSIIYMR